MLRLSGKRPAPSGAGRLPQLHALPELACPGKAQYRFTQPEIKSVGTSHANKKTTI